MRKKVILSEKTVNVLDNVASGSNLAEQLKAGALANATRDLEIAGEWFPLEEEPWQRLERQ